MKSRAIQFARVLPGMFALSVAVAVSASAATPGANQARWADANDPVARQLIEHERKWATDSCTPNNDIAVFIADDFVGTSPSAKLYTKSEMVPSAGAPQERDCKMISARVRYFGPNVAVIYGRESSMIRGADGKDTLRILVWTDTVLRRGGKWQVIAVQDMVAEPD